MKKTFDLVHPKIKPERMIDSVKHDIKKYMKRERSKTLPDNIAYWDFDCKIGRSEASAEFTASSEMNKKIDELVADGVTSFYVEVIAKHGKPKG